MGKTKTSRAIERAEALQKSLDKRLAHYTCTCKAWFSFLWQKHIEMHQNDRLAKSHDFVVHMSLMISWPVSHSYKLATDFSRFLEKSNSKSFGAACRVPDNQLNPKKMLSSHVWLHSATKCADLLFVLFQDGCQQNTGQNVESTKCKL